MNPVELNAYRLTFKNGTLQQVFDVLRAINDVEDDIPDNLLSDVISTMRKWDYEMARKCSYVVYDLLGKTKSEALYRAADELGYFDVRYSPSKFHLTGQVCLFVNHSFYHPDAEEMAVDELFKWLTLIEQNIYENYREELTMVYREVHRYDHAMKESLSFTSPMLPAFRIIKAVHNIGSVKAKESLRAMEYLFRPKVNDYLLIEQKWARKGDPRAKARPEELGAGPFDTESVYHLQAILDWMIRAASSLPEGTPVATE